MTVSTTVPATIQIKRRHLVGVIVAVAALVAALTWALTELADTTTGQTRTTDATADVGLLARAVADEIVAVENRPIRAADAYHGVSVMVCLDNHRPVNVADAYHGVGIAICI